MLKIQNNLDTVVIVVHEIYGINQHMRDFCHSLSKEGFDVVCPNLLNEELAFDYSQEKIAYENFMMNIGFTIASDKIKSVFSNVNDNYKKVFVIGFSVGATVAWLCTEKEHVAGMVGYYGSRIRDYVDVEPQCPTMLFFPQKAYEKLVSFIRKH